MIKTFIQENDIEFKIISSISGVTVVNIPKNFDGLMNKFIIFINKTPIKDVNIICRYEFILPIDLNKLAK